MTQIITKWFDIISINPTQCGSEQIHSNHKISLHQKISQLKNVAVATGSQENSEGL